MTKGPVKLVVSNIPVQCINKILYAFIHIPGGEALLLFSSRTNIRGLYLESKILFQVVKKQRQIIGVEYDGNHVYWTDVHLGTESILRSLEDGSQMEVSNH